MTGYVFCLEPHETGVGYQFIVANKSRLEKMDLEESTIDLAVATTPRIVVNEIVYDVSRQYFRKESDGQGFLRLQGLCQLQATLHHRLPICPRIHVFLSFHITRDHSLLREHKAAADST